MADSKLQPLLDAAAKAKAHLQCFWWCLTHWQSELREYRGGKLVKLSACTGSLRDDSIVIHKVFWERKLC